jgi:hypothetical protein
MDKEEQLGFELGLEPANEAYSPNLAEVREDMRQLLEVARAAETASPWDERALRYNRIVFVQMSRWLPEEEAEQLCFEFLTHYERIEKLLAA